VRRYLGRGIGAVAGLPAGPGGVIFGFLIGALVDQYVRRAPLDGAFEGYLARPESEGSHDRALFYATATCTAVVLGSFGNPGSAGNDEMVHRIAMTEWPRVDASGDPHRNVTDRRRRVLRHALSRGPLIPWQRVVRDIARRRTRSSDPVPLPALESLLEIVVGAAVGMIGAGAVPDRGDAFTDTEGYRLITELSDAAGIDLYRVSGGERLLAPLLDDDCRILGVSPEVTSEELKRVYRILVSQMHPDTAGGLDERRRRELSDALIRIRDAYDRVHALVLSREGREGTTRTR